MKSYTTNLPDRDAKPTSGFEILLILCTFLFFNALTFGQGNGQYYLGGPGTPGTSAYAESNANGVTPFMSTRRDSRNQYLYPAGELTSQFAGAGNITHLAFYVTAFPVGSADKTMRNVNISIGTTTAGVLPAPVNIATNVYATIPVLSITDSIPSSGGWVTFDLTKGAYANGFAWNGTDNIVVQICQNSTAKANFTTQNFKVKASQFTSSGNTMNNGFYNSSNIGSSVSGCSMQLGATGTTAASSSPLRQSRPDIQFTFDCASSPQLTNTAVCAAGIDYCIGATNVLSTTGGSLASGITYQWERSTVSEDTGYISIIGAKSATYNAVKTDVDTWYRRLDMCVATDIGNPIAIGAKTWTLDTDTMTNDWKFEGAFGATPPGSSESAVFDADYTAATDLSFCSIAVKSGTVNIPSGKSVLLQNQVTLSGGSLTFENTASLNQVNSVLPNSGCVTVKRNTQPVRRYDYTYWSSPVVNQSLYSFSPDTRPDKYYSWTHSSQEWLQRNPSITNMDPGIGYIIRAPDNYAINGNGTVWHGEFKGVLNNGDFTVLVTGNSNPSPLPDDEKWNLIGNPYPSSLDAIAFYNDPLNKPYLDGTFYVWTHNSTPSSEYDGDYTYNYNPADYAYFNMVGGVGFSATLNSPVEPGDIGYTPNATPPDRYIASGQSFMIKGKVDGTNQVTFKNSFRSTPSVNNSNFYKPAVAKIESQERSRVWLEYINEKGGFKQLLVGYLDGATHDYDSGYDGEIMSGSGVSFFSIIKNHKLGIQGKGLPFQNTDTIPLGFTATVAGNNTITLVNYDGLFDNQEVFLEDTYLNLIHNLKTSNYSFVSPIGIFLDRFVLKFTENTLNLNPNAEKVNNIVAFKKSGNLVVNAENISIASVKVYDLSGRLIVEKNNCQSTSVVFEKQNWNAQLLLVQITTEDKAKVTRKVLF